MDPFWIPLEAEGDSRNQEKDSGVTENEETPVLMFASTNPPGDLSIRRLNESKKKKKKKKTAAICQPAFRQRRSAAAAAGEPTPPAERIDAQEQQMRGINQLLLKATTVSTLHS